MSSAPSERIEQHEIRIHALEQSDIDKQRRLDALESNHNDLKITIMEENRDSRRAMQSQFDKLLSVVTDDKVREDDIRKERNKAITDVLIKLGGAGGAIYILIEWLAR